MATAARAARAAAKVTTPKAATTHPRTRKQHAQQQVIASVRYRHTDAQGRLIFSAPSRTTPGLEYMVTADERGHCRCSCPRGTYKGNCAHGLAAKAWMEMRALAMVETAIPSAQIERERVARAQRSANPYATQPVSGYDDYGRGSFDYARQSNPHESGPAYYDPHGGLLD